ncbi:MAG: 1-pyrroline-5-carboxylate dehydrogenase, partial [Vibrio casei]
EGVITPLVAETVDGTSTSGHDLVLTHDPSLVLSFITERTRTINITAVGGNATLLELGDQH